MTTSQPIYIVDGVRTPFLKSRNRPGPFAASDLATDAGRALLLRQAFDPTRIDEVILGCAAPSPDEVNIARVASLRMGCGEKVPAWTVMRNCASGMQAMDAAMTNILAGREQPGARRRRRCAVTRAAACTRTRWCCGSRTGMRRRRSASGPRSPTKFRPAYLAPVIGLMKGLTDPIVGLLMGQTAENVAYRFGITREQMDAYAARSHQRVLAAQRAGHFDNEVVPLYDKIGQALRGR